MLLRVGISLITCLMIFGLPVLATDTARPPGASIDVNQPRTQYECDTPIGINWFGSTKRCLEEMCGGQNVTNEWIFDQFGRARKNPCAGMNPFQFEQK